uniref:L-seryl-tRNA(Sec) kinase n=1 Tax=Eptatretus burgeri TaxID=7764 RepID=A0A8C4QEJ3_EPTBU
MIAGPARSARGTCVLCVLCGLPGSGKSTLCARLPSRTDPRFLQLSYDSLLPAVAFRPQDTTGGKVWTLFLRQLQQHRLLDPPWSSVKALSAKPQMPKTFPEQSPPGLAIILDDNFYYRSMRYKVYQLAREVSAGFIQIFLNCPLEQCLKRNASRTVPVPVMVLQTMAARLEVPDVERDWERESLHLDTSVDVEVVERFTYLGSDIHVSAGCDSEVNRRLGRAWGVMDSLDHGVWCCRYLCGRTKVRVLRSLVLPVLLYGCETWTLMRNLRWRLNSFGTRSLQGILGYRWLDFVSNERLLRETQMRFVTCIVRERQLRLYGHVAHSPDADPVHQILSVREPREWRTPIGRPRAF